MSQSSGSSGGLLRSGGGRVLGCVGVLVVLAALVVGFQLFENGADTLAAPWAYGNPTLTGDWEGTFTTPTGIRFAMFIEIERARDKGGAPVSDDYIGEIMGGRGDWCDNHGRHLEDSPVFGSVASYTGFGGKVDNLDLKLQSGDPPGNPPPEGLLPAQFHGSWNGDTLTLKPEFSFWTGTAFQASDNPDQTQPMTITLERGDLDTYRSACAKLD